MVDEKIKHLEFIQIIITRMNTNSFQIKGWNITIVSAFLAVFASNGNEYLLITAILPPLMFWFLDSYYLMMERRFRGLYADVGGVSENPKKIKTFAMRPNFYTKKIDKKYSYWNVFRSVTIWPIYLFIIILLSILFFYFNCK